MGASGSTLHKPPLIFGSGSVLSAGVGIGGVRGRELGFKRTFPEMCVPHLLRWKEAFLIIINTVTDFLRVRLADGLCEAMR